MAIKLSLKIWQKAVFPMPVISNNLQKKGELPEEEWVYWCGTAGETKSFSEKVDERRMDMDMFSMMKNYRSKEDDRNQKKDRRDYSPNRPREGERRHDRDHRYHGNDY
jgi:hypothetical protein